MSLVVSLRVPDGIVMATDSLSTAHQIITPTVGDIGNCPSCNTKIKMEELNFPSIPIPFSASSYTEKLFPFLKKIGISSFGTGVINDRSIGYHLKEFESQLQSRHEEGDFILDKLKEELIEYFMGQLKQWKPYTDPHAPPDWNPLGIHLNGFEGSGDSIKAITYELYIGKDMVSRLIDTVGCTIGGRGEVVRQLWGIGKEDPAQKFKYGLFSLQDAIDHAEFLITTTRDFQRFSNMVPSVGGEIDVALITPTRGFQWIKRKKLMEILEEPRNGNNG